MSDVEFDLDGGCFDDLSDGEITKNTSARKGVSRSRPKNVIDPAQSDSDAEMSDNAPETSDNVGKGQWDYDVIVGAREHKIGSSLRAKLNERFPGLIIPKPDNGDINQRQSRPATGSDREWGTLGLSKQLLKAVYDKLKFNEPSEVQESVIPLALARKDVLVTAETGSGKTASFLLPVCEMLLNSQGVRARRRGPSGEPVGGKSATRSIILLPTRELAVQCHSMLNALTSFTLITSALVVGGSDSTDQLLQLRRQPDIIISTPGRLLDLVLNSSGVYLDKVDVAILDEADRLLEIGFKDEITAILRHCSKQKQTLLFSATVSKELTGLLAAIDVKDPVHVQVNKSHQMVDGLVQEFVKIADESFREAALVALIQKHTGKVASALNDGSVGDNKVKEVQTTNGRSIIFFKEKREAHRLAIVLGILGFHCFELHGDLPQKMRVTELSGFQRHTDCFLLATDLASRGLDLPEVNLVINYNLPQCDIETRYTHRVGRTARMGRTGKAVTIYSGDEYKAIKKLVKTCVHEEGTLFERKLNASELNVIKARIGDKGEVIEEISKDEAVERELAMAERDAEKVENMAKHKGAIFSKPAKVWIDSANDRDKKDRMQQGKERAHMRKERKVGMPGAKRDRKENGKDKKGKGVKKSDKGSIHKKKFDRKGDKGGDIQKKKFDKKRDKGGDIQQKRFDKKGDKGGKKFGKKPDNKNRGSFKPRK